MGVARKSTGRQPAIRRSQNDFASDTFDPLSEQPELELQPSREKLGAIEKQSIGRRISKRLERLGENPWKPNTTTLVDIEVERGRQFVLSSVQERQLIPATAAERAADMAISFDLFKQSHDLKNMRHVVLRPVASKVEVHNLDARLKLFSDDLSRHIGRLVTDRKVQPILTTIHITLCQTTNKIDLHSHTVWIATDDNHRTAREAVECKFSCFWTDPKLIKKPGALINYMVSWVVDHREAVGWPDEVLLAVWRLTKARMVRPAGAFAKFRATLKGKRLVRHADGTVTAIDIQKRRQPRTERASEESGFRGYARVKLDQTSRLCAIFVTPRIPLLGTGPEIGRDAVNEAMKNARTVRAFKSTAKKGVSPQGWLAFNAYARNQASRNSDRHLLRPLQTIIATSSRITAFARGPPDCSFVNVESEES